MRAVVLVGHGSLRAGSGAAMIRLAARVREAGAAPLAAAGFLNYSRPTLSQALDRCIERGASEIAIMPYFLVPGAFASVDLPRAVAAAQRARPDVPLRLTRCFDDHPALAALATQRAETVRSSALPAALLLMAHGSPDGSANRPIFAVAQRIADEGRYAAVQTSFLDLNPPSIPHAIAELIAHGHQQIIAVPYFLQLGGHVAHDLPEVIATAQQVHPDAHVHLAPHLGYDPLLAEVIRDRVAELFADKQNVHL